MNKSEDTQTNQLMLTPIKAGFPSPAEDTVDVDLNLHKFMVKRPAATFFMRVSGDSMKDAGIFNEDIIVIDRSLEPTSGDVVVAYVDGEFTLKTFKIAKSGKKGWLIPANDSFEPIEVSAENDFQIWGVITFTVHSHRKQ